MPDPLLIALALAGLVVGATGTFSPCGFSMVETIGPTGHDGGLRTTVAASATFAPFAVLGGVVTFGLLAVGGSLIGGGTVAYAVAALLAAAAAAAEARGIAIVPQVRRQLPVGWRRDVSMPLAAAGYGVLLGLGFTTFILSYGVWALMGIALAVGDPAAGLVLGVAFGIGRAGPIVLLAPLADRPAGERACEAMAMNPRLYRRARRGDALALALVAAALATGAAGAAARPELPRAHDPSSAGELLAYQRPDGVAMLRRGGAEAVPLPGTHAAVGRRWIAVVQQGRVALLDRGTLAEVGALRRDADAVAVAGSWLVFRTATAKRDLLRAAPISRRGRIGTPRPVAKLRRPGQLSQPALSRSSVIYAVSKPRRSKLVRAKLRPRGRPAKRTLLQSRNAAYTAPSISGKRIAYVLSNRKRQVLRLKGLGGGKGRALHRAKPGPPTLWSTAIAAGRVYFTVVKGGGAARVLSSPRR